MTFRINITLSMDTPFVDVDNWN